MKVIRRRRGKPLPPNTVYVGRPSRWGNPFEIGRDGTREEVIAKYREWIQIQPDLMAALPSLRGRDLACWCAPLPCHADVLAELANRSARRCWACRHPLSVVAVGGLCGRCRAEHIKNGYVTYKDYPRPSEKTCPMCEPVETPWGLQQVKTVLGDYAEGDLCLFCQPPEDWPEGLRRAD